MSARPAAALRQRLLDVLGSIFIYNEHRGYTALDRVIAAMHLCRCDHPAFLAAIASHRAARWPENAAYILRNVPAARAGMLAFAEIPEALAVDTLVRACQERTAP